MQILVRVRFVPDGVEFEMGRCEIARATAISFAMTVRKIAQIFSTHRDGAAMNQARRGLRIGIFQAPRRR